MDFSFNEGLSVGSIAASLYTSYKKSDSIEDQANRQASEYTAAAEANAVISRYDANIVRKQAVETAYVTNVAVTKHRQNLDLFIGSQKARFGKSGVALGTGTPVDVINYSIDQARSDELVIRNEGRKKVSNLRDLANRYDLLAEKGLRDGAAFAALTLEAGSDMADIALYEGFEKTGEQVYKASEQYGWF